MGKGRIFYDVVVLKGTFGLAAGSLERSHDQVSPVLADEYHGTDAALSSVSRPGDLLVGKPATDVIITGEAVSPGAIPCARWSCVVSVRRGSAELLRAHMMATGPRRYRHRLLGGWKLSEPEPVSCVPLRYELAYGGSYRRGESEYVVDEENPAGRGFFDLPTLDAGVEYDGPQWETPNGPARGINETIPLAGFGPVARHWASRSRYGGTYDAVWELSASDLLERGQVPDYPVDMDMRFFQCAHPSMVAPSVLRGGDEIRLLGFTEGEHLAFLLPARTPRCSVFTRDGTWIHSAMALDLVHIDLETETVLLTWRTSISPQTNAREAVLLDA